MPGTNDIATDENAAEAVDPFDTRAKHFVFIERDYINKIQGSLP